MFFLTLKHVHNAQLLQAAIDVSGRLIRHCAVRDLTRARSAGKDNGRELA